MEFAACEVQREEDFRDILVIFKYEQDKGCHWQQAAQFILAFLQGQGGDGPVNVH